MEAPTPSICNGNQHSANVRWRKTTGWARSNTKAPAIEPAWGLSAEAGVFSCSQQSRDTPHGDLRPHLPHGEMLCLRRNRFPQYLSSARLFLRTTKKTQVKQNTQAVEPGYGQENKRQTCQKERALSTDMLGS